MVVGHAGTEDNFCYALLGTKVRKMHSSRRDAFKPINSLPLAKIHENGEIEKILEHKKRNEQEKVKINTDFEEKTALVKYYPGANPEIIEHYIKDGYRGIVIEGTGFGHVATEGPVSWLPVLKKACEKMVVCMTTQTVNGRVNSKVYSAGRLIEKAGVIYTDMLSETAFVKLGCLLGREKDLDTVKQLMQENLAHEFSERVVE
jgi:glutamyl-tRNA(Gln) amidotransferase subunit D